MMILETEHIILVDEHDGAIGVGEKLITHLQGKLHRAVSIFIFNSKGQLLLQQRAPSKYHSGGLWTNTCCGHPRPNELTLDAAKRRLWEEMGICCELTKAFEFTYKAPLDNQITEYEFDHVFIGQFEGSPNPNPEEASAWKWMAPEALEQDILDHPQHYTVWFKMILHKVLQSSLESGRSLDFF